MSHFQAENCTIVPGFTRWLDTLLLMGFSIFFLLTMEALVRPGAVDGFYFQPWSSETMMQTVSIQDLQEAPLESLANIHIQPPLFDAMRAVLAQTVEADGPAALLRQVDGALYLLWALAYGAMMVLLYLWLRRLTSRSFALFGALLFALHPAAIFYATLLDATFISALLILWSYYLLQHLADNPRLLLLTAFGLMVLALFFTRSVFQWPAILIMALAIYLIGVPKRGVLLFLLIVGGLSGLYLAKQYVRFDLLSTSSFTGFNLTNSIGIGDPPRFWNYPATEADKADEGPPRVLTRIYKFNGTPNYNHRRYLELNRGLMEDYRERLRTISLANLAAGYWQNLELYFRPSSHYTNHVLVDRLPWRAAYDRLFSAPILPLLLMVATAVWGVSLWRDQCPWAERLRRATGFALPGLFVFSVTVLFEKGENMRLKFLLEPVLFLFIAVQLHHLARYLVRRATEAWPR